MQLLTASIVSVVVSAVVTHRLQVCVPHYHPPLVSRCIHLSFAVMNCSQDLYISLLGVMYGIFVSGTIAIKSKKVNDGESLCCAACLWMNCQWRFFRFYEVVVQGPPRRWWCPGAMLALMTCARGQLLAPVGSYLRLLGRWPKCGQKVTSVRMERKQLRFYAYLVFSPVSS